MAGVKNKRKYVDDCDMQRKKEKGEEIDPKPQPVSYLFNSYCYYMSTGRSRSDPPPSLSLSQSTDGHLIISDHGLMKQKILL